VTHPLQLTRFDAAAKPVWRVLIQSDRSSVGVLAADWGGVYVATLDPSASCAVVRAYRGDGNFLWERSVGCLGPPTHGVSENDVMLDLGSDRLFVWGAEGASRYLTALDRRTGKSLCERRFDPPTP
jgi:hypothetical protein